MSQETKKLEKLQQIQHKDTEDKFKNKQMLRKQSTKLQKKLNLFFKKTNKIDRNLVRSK